MKSEVHVYAGAMWLVRGVTVQRATLDFSSSSGGHREVTQLLADGVLFANAIELTDWTGARAQVLVCESCGIEHCAPGGWLAPRAAGDLMVFTPAFEDMGSGDSERAEYRPPPYVANKGIPAFSRALYASFAEVCNELPSFDALPPLCGRDLALCLQLEAPGAVLGRFPALPELEDGKVLVTADEDRRLVRLLSETLHAIGACDAVRIECARPNTATMPLYVDAPRGAHEWRALAMEGRIPRLLPMHGHVAIPASEGAESR